MSVLNVNIKHAGKTHKVQLDQSQPGLAFKENVYQITGVPLDRMKVMVPKVGQLKDDTDWSKVAPKENQTFMVLGSAGELPKAPTKPIVFLEDLDDADLAEALAKPVGLRNLGNTCYMNATVQAFRAIPELQTALAANPPAQPVASGLGTLYNNMGKTTDSVMPVQFLSALRQAVPQFGEMGRGKGAGGIAGYAQQDAEECWGAITSKLNEVEGLPTTSGRTKFVDQFMMGEIRRELSCDEAPEEDKTTVSEKVAKIECNISISTNYMHTGILDALDTKLEKNSPSLGRQAIYSQKSRMERLPAYLTVHMVRMVWRPDIGKKAKIMRKVKFPLEFDALDLTTEGLKAKLLPVSRRVKEIEKERAERRKVRKRTKVSNEEKKKDVSEDVEMTDAAAGGSKDGAALKDESIYRAKEKAEFDGLVNEGLKADVGASLTGLYDLVAIVTHKGAAADSGHYMGYVKKSVFHSGVETEDDEDWYKFDDDKVSIFPAEKLTTLDGGGEDSSAYILLYKSKVL